MDCEQSCPHERLSALGTRRLWVVGSIALKTASHTRLGTWMCTEIRVDGMRGWRKMGSVQNQRMTQTCVVNTYDLFRYRHLLRQRSGKHQEGQLLLRHPGSWHGTLATVPLKQCATWSVDWLVIGLIPMFRLPRQRKVQKWLEPNKAFQTESWATNNPRILVLLNAGDWSPCWEHRVCFKKQEPSKWNKQFWHTDTCHEHVPALSSRLNLGTGYRRMSANYKTVSPRSGQF